MFVNVGDNPPELFEDLRIDVLNNQFYDNASTGMEVQLTRGTIYCRLIGNTYYVGSTANDMFLDNNSGTTSNFKAQIIGNQGPLQTDNIEVVP